MNYFRSPQNVRKASRETATDDDELLSLHRKEVFGVSIPGGRAWNESLGSDTRSSFLRDCDPHRSKLTVEPDYESKAIAGAMRALQRKVARLERENRDLRDAANDFEQKADPDQEQRLLQEVAASKERERELIAKFQRLDVKLKAETKRIRYAEANSKDANSELVKQLERANALNNSLSLRVDFLERENRELLSEIAALEQRFASFDSASQIKKQTLTSSLRPAELSLTAMEEASQPSPDRREMLTSLTEDFRESQRVQESTDAQNSMSESGQESHLIRYLGNRKHLSASVSLAHRDSSLQCLSGEKLGLGGRLRTQSNMSGTRLITVPSSPIEFNPIRPGLTEGIRVNVVKKNRARCR